MDHIVKQIAECNTITETLVRITYCHTEYRCPSETEIQHDARYDEENHHCYSTTQRVCILSVHGSKSDEWIATPQFVAGLRTGKIHAKRLNAMIEEMTRCGIWTETSYDNAVYNENHYHLIITKVEMMN